MPKNIFYISVDDTFGMDAISLVDAPAVEVDFLCFNKEEKKQLQFANEDKHIITGVVCLCDTPIYRYSPAIGDYWVVFNPETIEKMVLKYSKNKLWNSINLDHNNNLAVESVIMMESYMIDKERGICPKEFENIPDHSWVCSFKVEDENLWNTIKNTDLLNGFSLQGEFQLEEKFKQINKVEKMNKIVKAILKLADMPTDKGMITVTAIEIGEPVFMTETEEPAADGEYVLEDGTKITVEGGVIIEIEAKEEPVEEPEPIVEPIEQSEEEQARIAELEAQVAELTTSIEEKDAKIAELEAALAEKEAQVEEMKKQEPKNAKEQFKSQEVKKSGIKFAN